MAIADLITMHDEVICEDQPLTIFHPIETWKKFTVENFYAEELLKPIVQKGKLVYEFPALLEVKAFSLAQKEKFWEEYLRLDMPQTYKVDLSNELHSLKINMIDSIRSANEKKDS